MDLRQLEYFQAVSQLSSISKASEKFHISQPSVTVAIQKLEEELGVQLFDRSQRKIALTAEGTLFLQRVTDILSRLQYSIAELNECKVMQKGRIKLGITPIVGGFLFPYIFSEFCSRYPHFEFQFVEEGSLAIRRKLERGELDIGILITSNTEILATMPITNEQIVLSIAHNHPLSALDSVAFEKLQEYPFVLFKDDTYVRKRIMDECTKFGVIPQILFTSRHIETILSLVEQGDGVSFVPETIARKHANVCYRPLAQPLFFQAGLAWNHNRYLSQAAKTFIDFASENFRGEADLISAGNPEAVRP